MMHALYICCENPTEILGAVANGILEQGVTLQGMTMTVGAEVSEVNVTVNGEVEAVHRLTLGLQQLAGVTCVEDLSAEEQDWFVTAQICEVYS
jgi:hypothetical protein